ncbi:MAG: preprotein translocase subunit SecE [Spirochaetes bacterium]|nr:preprotein translocase subunit SecE [Spirochaetota bacterium]
MKKVFTFFKEAREELGRVSWPTQDEITKYTIVTVITLFVMSIFLWIVDSALMQIIKLVIK